MYIVEHIAYSSFALKNNAQCSKKMEIVKQYASVKSLYIYIFLTFARFQLYILTYKIKKVVKKGYMKKITSGKILRFFFSKFFDFSSKPLTRFCCFSCCFSTVLISCRLSSSVSVLDSWVFFAFFFLDACFLVG